MLNTGRVLIRGRCKKEMLHFQCLLNLSVEIAKLREVLCVMFAVMMVPHFYAFSVQL